MPNVSDRSDASNPSAQIDAKTTKASRPGSAGSASASMANATGDAPASCERDMVGHTFSDRHIGPDDAAIARMLRAIGCDSLEGMIAQTIPPDIRLDAPLQLPGPLSEEAALRELRAIASKNRVCRSLIGMGYYDTITPPVIQRNILENPGWYTQYTPYQAEISQGRLEALLNFQTMVADLTGLPLANASLLDEATAAAEAMHMCMALREEEFEAGRRAFFVAADCHPQTINVVKTRAEPLGVEIVVGDPIAQFSKAQTSTSQPSSGFFGVLLQYPNTYGAIYDYSTIVENARAGGALIVAATDLLALTLIKPPGEWGADIAVGSAQRFGVPLGGGGPHAAFMATKTEYARQMPGRIIGVSKDVHGKPGYRLAIQTREQHIRREKATSNICTAQVLLAIMASMYAVYHGPKGLRRIAERVHRLARLAAAGFKRLRHPLESESFFDTIHVHAYGDAQAIVDAASRRGINLNSIEHGRLTIALDETTTAEDLTALFASVVDAYPELGPGPSVAELAREIGTAPTYRYDRTSEFLTHPVFNSYHSEHEMLRYIKRLESRDLSLTTSMIPLGSCTMKLNAAAEMFPVSWPEFAKIHPFAPADQQAGYAEMCRQLENWLAEITGFAAVSLQPNSGAQGEYAGLLAIRAYHEANTGDVASVPGGPVSSHRTSGLAVTSPSQASSAKPQAPRDVCLIPVSAHGTNPASAVMAGFRVVAVKCDASGNVDIPDLRAKAAEHADRLGALMITYPSTHGVFEEGIREICRIVHDHGGLVYMDGANMNAQVGLTRPAEIGADVCHLNLHKTFCIPHGGGGPGMGPIAVTERLAPFLPAFPLSDYETIAQSGLRTPEIHNPKSVGPVSAAPWGSASILTISWMYIRMMGEAGLKKATQVAILNANYIAARLNGHYKVLYTGKHGRCAHECIVDCRSFEPSAGVKVEDIAKRLMDYGFHAPTMSFPVPGTLMIEPTESESLAELDRFCEAMISIRGEIRAIEEGRLDRADNPLKHAPHTAAAVSATDWPHKYPREQAAYPAPWLREHKFWPPVGRVDNVYGDRNLFCKCVPVTND